MTTAPDSLGPLELTAYLGRISWTGPLAPNLATLEGLQRAHLATIPFENLDVQTGTPIRLDLAALQDKLVTRRRGGYCFEQNSLFAAALRTLGFAVTLREARVRRGATRLLGRTHLALEVALAGGPCLADVGFGADGPLGPVPFDGAEVTRFQETCRLVAEGPRTVLQVLRAGQWLDLYALEPHPVQAVDLEMASHYTSTHPDSRFVQTLTAQLSLAEGRWTLRNLSLAHRTAEGEEVRLLREEELLPVLRQRFGLEVPEGTRFHFQASDPSPARP